jgi:hypothetical protein
MKVIELTQGKFASVDDNVYDVINELKWYAHKTGKKYRAVRNNPCRKRPNMIFMHRVIWEIINGPIPEKLEIDHIDGNSLNNRVNNLRMCTKKQNSYNIHVSNISKTSKYRGVRLHKCGKWESYIMVNKKSVYIGLFDTENDAGRAYDIKAKQYFGEFATLNFPDENL